SGGPLLLRDFLTYYTMKSKSTLEPNPETLNKELGSEPILSVVCDERWKTVRRYVRPLIHTPQNLEKFWKAASVFPYLFHKSLLNGPQDLINHFFTEDINGNLTSDSLLWVVDDF